LVTVNVVDANNNAPKFEQAEYFTPVPESAVAGQQVTAFKKPHATCIVAQSL
jgi:hypothetical protein